ncbi:MAG: hypothetical protein ACI8P3_001976 [Saprospiraceae bacterium]
MIIAFIKKKYLMKYYLTFLTAILVPLFSFAQFEPVEKEKLTIIVTDGTDDGKKSEVQPSSYDKVISLPKNTTGKGGKGAKGAKNKANAIVFTDPIRPLGMGSSIQAAAFLERPKLGRAGFLLIFCVNDSIGDDQGNYEANGETYKGVYRLIRQKFTPKEPIPTGMAPYTITGTLFILGVS